MTYGQWIAWVSWFSYQPHHVYADTVLADFHGDEDPVRRALACAPIDDELTTLKQLVAMALSRREVAQ